MGLCAQQFRNDEVSGPSVHYTVDVAGIPGQNLGKWRPLLWMTEILHMDENCKHYGSVCSIYEVMQDLYHEPFL